MKITFNDYSYLLNNLYNTQTVAEDQLYDDNLKIIIFNLFKEDKSLHMITIFQRVFTRREVFHLNALFHFLVSLNLSKLVDAWSFAIHFEAISSIIGKCLLAVCVLAGLTLIGWLFWMDSK